MKNIPFNISARMAKLIGQENFANAEGAIIELVKNCYDADASVCIVVFKGSALYIIDDGDGMTEKIITDYWMTMGTNNKDNNLATARKARIRTGAKGIGRFALDRLGIGCEMITYTEKTCAVEWKVEWSKFDDAKAKITDITASIDDLDEFDFKSKVEEILSFTKVSEDFFKKHFLTPGGTIIKITALRDQWEQDTIKQLFQNLELLIPPLETNTFSIFLYSDNQANLYGKVKPAPFDDYDYKLVASVKSNHQVIIKLTRNELIVSALQDRGLFDASELDKIRYSLEKFSENGFEIDTTLENLLPGFKEINKVNQLNNIGPFDFTFYFLKRGGAQEKDEDERVFPYRSVDYSDRAHLLNNYGGIKLFRDNFRVRPYGEPKSSAFDWLELGPRVVQNPTVTRPGYRVRPNQVYGIINISKVSNLAFQDKSNREGLQENDTFSVFKELLLAIINVFENDRNQIMMALKKLFDNHNQREKAKSEAGKKIKDFNKKTSKKKKNTTPEEKQKLLDEAEDVINTSEEAIKALKEDIDELLNEQKILRVLASTGLTVSSFAHELKSLSGALIPRSENVKRELSKYIKPGALDSVQARRNPYVMLDDIRSDDERISQWLDFALSSLRKDKRKRVKINLVDYIEKLHKTWSSLLSLKKIELIIDKSKFLSVFFTGFEIDLDSIFNNLISNSVEAFVRPDATSKREIKLSFSLSQSGGISIVYQDSGPGLSTEISDLNQIFQPFFSTKRDPRTGELIGTGLGMWLVKSTIDEYKGTTRIGSDRPGFKLNITLPT
jgi:signal transduction histidine kinase